MVLATGGRSFQLAFLSIQFYIGYNPQSSKISEFGEHASILFIAMQDSFVLVDHVMPL